MPIMPDCEDFTSQSGFFYLGQKSVRLRFFLKQKSKIGGFNGYTTSQIAARLNMKEEDLLCKLKEKQLFNREQLRILIRLMGASSACFVIYFPTFELRQQVYFEVFGKELPLQKERQRRWKKN